MYTETPTTSKTVWALDPDHSELSFKVKHLMISTVTGYFKNYTIAVETIGDNFTSISSINVVVDVSSLNTNNEGRDAHLRSEDFFHVEKFKSITFDANNVTAGSDTDTLQGNLTIRGVTQPITLQVEMGGIATDPYGNTKAGFTVTGKISRKVFGLTWNAMTEAGGAVVGDEVKVHAEIQLIKSV